MTLTEYLNQEEPQRMPAVFLQKGEFTIGSSIKFSGELMTQIFINEYPSVEYVLINSQGALYTTDESGNAKSKSCFMIKKEEMFINDLKIKYS